MIIIDGQKSPLEVQHFANLEQLAEKVMADDHMQERVVTMCWSITRPFRKYIRIRPKTWKPDINR